MPELLRTVALEPLVAIAARRAGHEFWGIGEIPEQVFGDVEPLVEEGEPFLGVTFLSGVRSPSHEEAIALLDATIAVQLFGWTVLANEQFQPAKSLDSLLRDGRGWATEIRKHRRKGRRHQDHPDAALSLEQLILVHALRMLDLFADPKIIRRVWILRSMLKEGKFIPSWVMEFIDHFPIRMPPEFLELDWYQAGVREVISQRLKEIA